MRKVNVVAPLLLGACLATVVQAGENESTFMLGLGVSSEDSIYKGVGRETDILPMIAYEQGRLSIFGPSVSYNLIEHDAFEVSLLAQYRMDGYDASDSADLAGMADREGAFELGAAITYENDYGEWSAQALTDISNEHEGYELELGWEKPMRLSQNWSVAPAASIAYRSDDMNTYYYGVSAAEATVQRAAYTAGGDTIYELGISAQYTIDQQQGIRIGASYQKFGDEISNSSIVEDDSSTEISAVYIYRF